jgi:hypothetical protein
MIRKSLIVFVFLGSLFAAATLSPDDELRLLRAKADAAEARAEVNIALTQLLQSPGGRDFLAKQDLANKKLAEFQAIQDELAKKYKSESSEKKPNADNRNTQPRSNQSVSAK